MNLNPYLDKNQDVPRLKEKADKIFGRPGAKDSLDWVFPPEDYPRVMDFILSNDLSPKLPADPVWLSFKCTLIWKPSVLPRVQTSKDVPEDSEGKTASPIFIANMRAGGRFMFLGGIDIPLSVEDPASYEFLGKFSEAAPFKMKAKNFNALIPNKIGRIVWKRPDGEIAKRLNEVI